MAMPKEGLSKDMLNKDMLRRSDIKHSISDIPLHAAISPGTSPGSDGLSGDKSEDEKGQAKGLIDGLTKFFTPSNKRHSRVSLNSLSPPEVQAADDSPDVAGNTEQSPTALCSETNVTSVTSTALIVTSENCVPPSSSAARTRTKKSALTSEQVLTGEGLIDSLSHFYTPNVGRRRSGEKYTTRNSAKSSTTTTHTVSNVTKPPATSDTTRSPSEISRKQPASETVQKQSTTTPVVVRKRGRPARVPKAPPSSQKSLLACGFHTQEQPEERPKVPLVATDKVDLAAAASQPATPINNNVIKEKPSLTASSLSHPSPPSTPVVIDNTAINSKKCLKLCDPSVGANDCVPPVTDGVCPELESRLLDVVGRSDSPAGSQCESVSKDSVDSNANNNNRNKTDLDTSTTSSNGSTPSTSGKSRSKHKHKRKKDKHHRSKHKKDKKKHRRRKSKDKRHEKSRSGTCTYDVISIPKGWL